MNTYKEQVQVLKDTVKEHPLRIQRYREALKKYLVDGNLAALNMARSDNATSPHNARHAHLAYMLLRGKEYRLAEQKCHVEPNVWSIHRQLTLVGTEYVSKENVQAWLKGEFRLTREIVQAHYPQPPVMTAGAAAA